jgi:hypothetical protein
MQQGEVLRSEPVSIVEIEISSEYVQQCEAWLQTQGCRMVYTQGSHYRIHLPEGTREETRAGISTLYVRRTYLVFPSGVVLPKYILYPIHRGQPDERVTLGFPSELFTRSLE